MDLQKYIFVIKKSRFDNSTNPITIKHGIHQSRLVQSIGFPNETNNHATPYTTHKHPTETPPNQFSVNLRRRVPGFSMSRPINYYKFFQLNPPYPAPKN